MSRTSPFYQLQELLGQDILSCELCYKLMEIPPSCRGPKCLDCSHYFCGSCLENHLENMGIFSMITCPACQIETTVGAAGVAGLNDNLTIIRILARLNKLSFEEKLSMAEITMSRNDDLRTQGFYFSGSIASGITAQNSSESHLFDGPVSHLFDSHLHSHNGAQEQVASVSETLKYSLELVESLNDPQGI